MTHTQISARPTASDRHRLTRPVAPVRGRLTPLGLTESKLTDTGFWGERARRNADATLEHCLTWQEQAGWLGNFDRVANGRASDGRQGREFSDSEAYKLLEAYCWEQAAHPSDESERVIRMLTARIAAAQDDDGYLNTRFGHDEQEPRYSDLEWGHELYNYGHLLQAAVARLRSHGEDELVALARRVADHVCDVFGTDGIQGVCGHPEIEVGLIEFARATGVDRYREQARLFIERRGHGTLRDIEWGRSYYQDDVPVWQTTTLRGHAVRALYLASAAADLAIDTDDGDLLEAVERQWENGVARRTYITGGMGSHHQDEAFGEDYELPSDRAYCESCAGIGSIMLSWRLLLATGKARYADLIERTLYNIVATAVAEDGRSFFYSNTLHRRVPGSSVDSSTQSKRANSSQRAPWFDVSCCPNNIARTLASLGGYLATVTRDGLQLHQYVDADVSTQLGDGRTVEVRMRTGYPAGGRIVVEVVDAPGGEWSIDLRVPAWAGTADAGGGAEAGTLAAGGARSARGATLELNGEPFGVGAVEPGYVRVTRVFEAGDTIVLTLPVAPRITEPDPRIDGLRGSIAVEAGPRVYCLESVDLPAGLHVDDVIVSAATGPRTDGERILLRGRFDDRDRASWPYPPASATGPAGRPVDAHAGRPVAAPAGRRAACTAGAPELEIPLVPYHHWANRGPASMRVWLRTE